MDGLMIPKALSFLLYLSLKCSLLREGVAMRLFPFKENFDEPLFVGGTLYNPPSVSEGDIKNALFTKQTINDDFPLFIGGGATIPDLQRIKDA